MLIAAGLLWFAQVSPDGTYVGDILFPSLLAAVGLGFAFVPMTIAAVAGVEPAEAGLARGLINTSQQVGGALGLAILATIANSRTDRRVRLGRRAERRVALTDGFQAAFLAGAGLAVLGVILALVLISGATAAPTPRRRSAGSWRPWRRSRPPRGSQAPLARRQSPGQRHLTDTLCEPWPVGGPTRSEIIRAFIPESPFSAKLGLSSRRSRPTARSWSCRSRRGSRRSARWCTGARSRR